MVLVVEILVKVDGGAILIYIDANNHQHRKTISGSELNTTNNKMELTAIIEGLKILKEKCDVDIYSDSKYVLDGITKWLPNWLKNNWKTSSKKPVKNKDLWEELNILTTKHKINWHWVKGHADDVLNNEVDRIAKNY